MSRVTRKEWYRRVNAEWPSGIPADLSMTPDEAVRAGRRLYRFITGRTFTGPVKVTSGNRDNKVQRGVMYVNPGADLRRGWHAWHRLAHDFGHRLASAAGVDPRHGGEHARLERRIVKEIVERGWLDGALKSESKPEQTREERIADERATRLAKIDVLIVGWERKAKRAANALSKLHKQRKRALKALDAPIPEEKPRAPRMSTKQQAEALAKEHGITIERHTDLESKPLWIACDALLDDADPFQGDHYAHDWSEALSRVRVYVEKLTGSKS